MTSFEKFDKTVMVEADKAIVGSDEVMQISQQHHVLGTSTTEFDDRHKQLVVAMGCFWGAEKLFWELDGVISTSVGFSGGYTKNPTYEQVCSGLTGHAEVVLVVYDPKAVTLAELIKVFLDNHDPTQGMRQGNDIGTPYRSAIYLNDASERELAQKMLDDFANQLSYKPNTAAGQRITTEVLERTQFYYAEDYHQQYLSKNPDGYCAIKGVGISCTIPAGE